MGVVCNSVVVVFMQFVLVLNLVLLMAKRSIAKYSSGSKIRERERESHLCGVRLSLCLAPHQT